MHLTRFRINPARRGARKLLASPQAMHAAVLASFPGPDQHTGDGARTLWRIDERPDRQLTLYIVSPGQPDLTHLVEQAGWPTVSAWETRPYDTFLQTLATGQRWAFRLTANPTHNVRTTDDAPGTQRLGHVTADYQLQWLLKRTNRAGFTISEQPNGNHNLVIHRRQTRRFTRKQGQRPVTLVTATYDGVLVITDPEAMRYTLTAGIGHARAYGCGLLTLATG
jgi:CRISPR system Cascade subunit CasE